MKPEIEKIPEVRREKLPSTLPSKEAIRSFGMNEHAYHPDMWELEYATYRYLGGMTDDALIQRYQSLVHSMNSFISPARGVVPIVSYQGSWYWYRKEHQTRMEFAVRGLDPPSIPILPIETKVWTSPNPVPNGTDVIFRYGKREHMRQLVDEGKVRFAPAQAYDDAKHNIARRDEELRKHRIMAGRYTKITMESGESIPIIGDVTNTVSGTNYHLVCFSCVWDEQLFSAFEGDTCVVVTNPDEFGRRIERAGKQVFRGWFFHHNPVQYFDPYEMRKNEYFDAGMSKDFQFAYQNEYRLLWNQLNCDPVEGHQFVDIGPSHDIMKMYDFYGHEVS